MKMRGTLIVLALALAAEWIPAPLAAQQYPLKPIRVIVPFPAGAVADNIARLLGKELAGSLGQPILVDNRPGADGTIAAEAVIKSPADGYTLLLGTNGPIIHVPLLRKKPPYDPLAAFTPVSFLGRFTFMLFVNPEVPARNVKELVEYARANSGKLNMGTGNMGAVLLSAQFAKLAGIKFMSVPYKGEAPALPDLVAGRVHAMFYATIGPALGLVKEGRLRTLATVLGQRSALAPEVPTISEAGFPGVSVTGWAGLYGPANLPQDITARVSRAVNEALRQPNLRNSLAQHAFEASGSTAEQLAAHIRNDLNETRVLLREAGIEPE